LVLFAASVAVAVMLYIPSIKPTDGLNPQSPPEVAVTVPTEVPFMNIVTVLLASAEPLIYGLVLVVIVPSAGVLITGAAGRISSTTLIVNRPSHVAHASSVVRIRTEYVPGVRLSLVRSKLPLI